MSGWGADFLKQNKESEAKANAAVAAAIEEQKGTTKGGLTWREQCPFQFREMYRSSFASV